MYLTQMWELMQLCWVNLKALQAERCLLSQNVLKADTQNWESRGEEHEENC